MSRLAHIVLFPDDQAAAVRELLSAQGFEAVSSHPDLAGIERCSGGQWPGAR